MHVLFLVPEGKGNVLQTVRVANTCDTVFAPAVGARAGHVVREVCRRVSEAQWHCSRVHTAPGISVSAGRVC